jgi:hypothetical protein
MSRIAPASRSSASGAWKRSGSSSEAASRARSLRAPHSRRQQAAQKIGGAAGNRRPGSEAERQAAERAGERIQARLKQLEAEEPPIEFRFTLADQWSCHLFVAVMRRYGIRPYRYRGQRCTTVMARLSPSFVNVTLWPEFLELQSTLAAYFDALTDRVIEQALEVKAGEAEEQQQAAPQLPPQEHQGSLL